jgi:hypothetical protein
VITGYRPNGYFETATKDGQKIQGETRQCCHCQATWEYRPGSGTRRGWCLKCNGFLCGQPACEARQKQVTGQFTNKTYSCIPFEDEVNRKRDEYDKDPRWKVLPSGIVVSTVDDR